MARIARVVLPGIPHHVTQRGNRRQRTFFSEADYETYRRLLAWACSEKGTEVWAWCLMPNHVHLILVPRTEDGLRASLAEAHRRYTSRVNAREGWRGHLWQERFHSVPLDEPYLLVAARYVERNPVKAGLARYPQDWPWSSARAHLHGVPDGLTRLQPLRSMVVDWPAFWADDKAHDDEALRRHTRTGRPLGSTGFVERAEQVLGRTLRPRQPGPRPASRRR